MFKLGDTVSLRALAKVADTNETFEGEYSFIMDGDSEDPFEVVNASQEAYANWQYPNEGIHTVTVAVTFQDGSPVPFMVQPLNLEVCTETKLFFWVDRLDTSKHLFNGRLLTESGSAVDGKAVKAYLNGSLLDEALTTNTTGYFSFERNFDPGEGKVFYRLEVAFEGSENQTASLNSTDFMDNSYTVCQTIQFDYMPSSNMTSITVEPQASDITVPTKTSEEMQEEAKEEGWLSIWHELSWSYPWYRLHVQININPTIHVGFNPLLIGGEISDWDGLEFFSTLSKEFIDELTVDLIGIFLGYVLAKGLSLWNWVGAALALAAKAALQFLNLMSDWSNAHRLRAIGLANIILAFITTQISIGKNFISALFNILYAGAMSSLYVMWGALSKVALPVTKLGHTWVDGVDVGINLAIAGAALFRSIWLDNE